MFGGPFSAVGWTPAAARTSPESSRRARHVCSRSTSRLDFVRRCSASEVSRASAPTQALPRLASSAGLRLENHELGRTRRDAARLRRSGGHYDDDKHVIVTGRPALRPLVGLILDTLSCMFYKHFSPIGAWERRLRWQVQLPAERERARMPPSRPSPHTPYPSGRPFHRVAGGRSELTSRPRSFACQAPRVHG